MQHLADEVTQQGCQTFRDNEHEVRLLVNQHSECDSFVRNLQDYGSMDRRYGCAAKGTHNSLMHRQNEGKPTLESMKGRMTFFQAVCAILNIFLGVALLSYPYAVAQGGLISIVILAVLCLGAGFTSKLIIRCFESPSVLGLNYPAVGQVAFDRAYGLGWFGRALVSIGTVMEFLGLCIVNDVFMSRNLTILFPSGLMSEWQISLLVFVLTVPAVMNLRMSEMTVLNILGFTAKVSLVSMMIFTYIYTQIAEPNLLDSGVNIEVWPASPSALSVSTGIFILSLCGHPCLPEVYQKMQDPSQFDRVLRVCFLAMFVLYSLIGTVGFLMFGRIGTSAVITESLGILADRSSDSGGVIFGTVLKLLIGLVTLGCYASVVPVLALISDIPEWVLGIEESPMRQRSLRVIELAAIVLLAYLLSDHLPYVEAISGSVFTMITSCICPPWFCSILCDANDSTAMAKGETLSRCQRGFYAFFVVFGLVFGLFLFFNDVRGLLE